jgi:transcriptional regulator with XRE-family HTH domain
MTKASLGFGATARRFREKREITQEQFASLVGLDRSYYGRVERGKANVTIEVIERVIRELDLTWAEFFAEFDKVR